MKTRLMLVVSLLTVFSAVLMAGTLNLRGESPREDIAEAAPHAAPVSPTIQVYTRCGKIVDGVFTIAVKPGTKTDISMGDFTFAAGGVCDTGSVVTGGSWSIFHPNAKVWVTESYGGTSKWSVIAHR